MGKSSRKQERLIIFGKNQTFCHRNRLVVFTDIFTNKELDKQMGKLNQVKERYIFISPTLQAGWEDESNINDFEGSKKLG